jgi:hypothetical protein
LCCPVWVEALRRVYPLRSRATYVWTRCINPQSPHWSVVEYGQTPVADTPSLTFRRIRCKSQHGQLYIESSSNPNSNTLEPDRPQHERPTICVIAQQYSSATFIL